MLWIHENDIYLPLFFARPPARCAVPRPPGLRAAQQHDQPGAAAHRPQSINVSNRTRRAIESTFATRHPPTQDESQNTPYANPQRFNRQRGRFKVPIFGLLKRKDYVHPMALCPPYCDPKCSLGNALPDYQERRSSPIQLSVLTASELMMCWMFLSAITIASIIRNCLLLNWPLF